MSLPSRPPAAAGTSVCLGRSAHVSEFEFAILGAGAIGSIIGGHLTRAGHRVAMLARGARAEELERRGLRIRGLAEFDTAVTTLRAPASLGGAGVLIVATKTPGTAVALAALRHARFDVTLSIQNGPLKNELLAEAFGRERVLGALADTSGELLPGGEVLFTRNVNILIGELDGTLSERAGGLARTLDACGVHAAATAGIVTLEWSKFCGWVGLMALSVSTRAETWAFLVDPDTARVLARLVRETGALARALGIALSDRAVLPAASICAGSEDAAVELILKIGREYRDRVPGHRMSSLQDLEARRPLEVEETLGFAQAKARALGLVLPTLDCFRHLVAGIDRVRRGAAA
jgi:2-dehydropantoate 2-reductase